MNTSHNRAALNQRLAGTGVQIDQYLCLTNEDGEFISFTLFDVIQAGLPQFMAPAIDEVERIAAMIFDHDHDPPESRPTEEACHDIARRVILRNGPSSPADAAQDRERVLTISVQGGCVVDVAGLPDGMTYIVDDADVQDETPPQSPATASGIQLVNNEGCQMAMIAIPGYGEKCAVDGCGHPVAIDYCGDTGVRVLVWSDINKDDPTHVIDLAGALESARRDDNDDAPPATENPSPSIQRLDRAISRVVARVTVLEGEPNTDADDKLRLMEQRCDRLGNEINRLNTFYDSQIGINKRIVDGLAGLDSTVAALGDDMRGRDDKVGCRIDKVDARLNTHDRRIDESADRINNLENSK